MFPEHCAFVGTRDVIVMVIVIVIVLVIVIVIVMYGMSCFSAQMSKVHLRYSYNSNDQQLHLYRSTMTAHVTVNIR